jgi:fructose-1,6-bisphosphatase/sedoheptulose 1,7-bisphosphatase-like protein
VRRGRASSGAALPERANSGAASGEQAEHAEQLAKMGVKIRSVFTTPRTCARQEMIFMTGVTDGNLLKGVRFFGEGIRTSSMILTLDERQVRFIDSVHLEKRPDIKVRFN